MSESSKYDLRGANIGNFAETVKEGGRQEATQHINSTEQDFDQLLVDFQDFVLGLQQKYTHLPESTNVSEILDAEIVDAKKLQPQRWQNFLNLKRLWNGGKKASLKVGEHFANENIWGKAAIAFLDGVLDEPSA